MGIFTVLNEETGERLAVAICPSCRETMIFKLGLPEHTCGHCCEVLELDWAEESPS